MTAAIESYYRFHAKVYDLTRWSFLFGRNELISAVAESGAPERILEIGCGTGRNLAALANRFPESKLTGIDISGDMLARAENRLKGKAKRIRLFREDILNSSLLEQEFDLIVFSYILSMINPGWRRAIKQASAILGPGGRIAVTDFNDSVFEFFKKWMCINHVRMDGHLRPELAHFFETFYSREKPAYGGAWTYFVFVGKKSF